MDEPTRESLAGAARRFGTPVYVYVVDAMLRRFDAVKAALEGRLGISYAVKANPNGALLRAMRGKVATLDVSSFGEVRRGLAAGYDPAVLTFSGPAKRPFELRGAVEAGVGWMIAESPAELEQLDALAGELGRVQKVLVRINPSRVPRAFGVNMAGKPSQFGIDEEDMPALLSRFRGQGWRHLQLDGFHCYSGTNSLSPEAIGENIGIMADLFARFADEADLTPRKLVFGSGFGIPYHGDQHPLDLAATAAGVNQQIDRMRKHPRLRDAACTLEMGRYLVGPDGYLLTSVVGLKHSRGTDIALLDAGFNNHLAACGMMGAVIRRNWPIEKVHGDVAAANREHLLVGPLCTTIDVLATKIMLPALQRGDVLAVTSSGAYGLTASPTRFISHPEPREVLVTGAEMTDITPYETSHVGASV
mgnify:CR=1 FL=1